MPENTNDQPPPPDDTGRSIKVRWDISVTTIGVFVAQLIAVTLYINNMENRIAILEKADLTIQTKLEEKAGDAARALAALVTERDGSRDRLTKLETAFQYQVEVLRRIEAKVEQISGRRTSLELPSTAN